MDDVIKIGEVAWFRANCPQNSTDCNYAVCATVPINDTTVHNVWCVAGGAREDLAISGKGANSTSGPTDIPDYHSTSGPTDTLTSTSGPTDIPTSTCGLTGILNSCSSMSAMANTAIGVVMLIVWTVLG